MKHFWGRTIAVGIVMFMSVAVSHAQERTPEDVQRLMEQKAPPAPLFVPGEVIVRMKPALRIRATDLSRLGVQEKQSVTSGGEIVYRIAPNIRTSMSRAQILDRTLQLVRQFAARPDVEYAQPNYILRIADKTPNDPRYP